MHSQPLKSLPFGPRFVNCRVLLFAKAISIALHDSVRCLHPFAKMFSGSHIKIKSLKISESLGITVTLFAWSARCWLWINFKENLEDMLSRSKASRYVRPLVAVLPMRPFPTWKNNEQCSATLQWVQSLVEFREQGDETSIAGWETFERLQWIDNTWFHEGHALHLAWSRWDTYCLACCSEDAVLLLLGVFFFAFFVLGWQGHSLLACRL